MMNGKNGKTIHLMMTEVKVGDYTMPKNKDQEGCKGCLNLRSIHSFCNSTPSATVNGKLLRCPCQICIIKTMCEISCAEFEYYIKFIGEGYYDNETKTP